VSEKPEVIAATVSWCNCVSSSLFRLSTIIRYHCELPAFAGGPLCTVRLLFSSGLPAWDYAARIMNTILAFSVCISVYYQSG